MTSGTLFVLGGNETTAINEAVRTFPLLGSAKAIGRVQARCSLDGMYRLCQVFLATTPMR